MDENGSGEVIDKGEQALALRLAGYRPQRISRQLGIPIDEVEALVEAALPTLSPQLREKLYRLDLQRLDELLCAHWVAALKGDHASALVCIRCLERRADMIGYSAPLRLEMQQLAAQAAPRETSTQRIRALLDRIAAEPRQVNGGEEAPQP